MAGEVHIKLPPHLAGLINGKIIEGFACGAFVLPFAADCVEEAASVSGAAGLFRVRASDESIPAISLPFLKHRPDIDQEDVVLSEYNAGVGRLAEGLRGVRAKSYINVVPSLDHSVSSKDLLRHLDGIF